MQKTKELMPLSPSRIKQTEDCLWLYYCSAVLKLPQNGNDGSRRGSCLHDLLEPLVRPRHRPLINKLLKTQSPAKVPAIYRFLEKKFKEYKLLPDEEVKPIYKKDPIRTNREEVYAMLMMIVNLEFQKEDDSLIHTEYAFDYVDPLGFRLKGFIDRINSEDDVCRVRDYKTSKSVFTDKELNTNLQAMIYTMVAKEKWPQFKKHLMRFVFARFPKKPYQDAPKFTEEQYEGLRQYLAYLSGIINNLNEKSACSNFAADNREKSWLCGRGSFRCAYRDEFDYWQIVESKSNKIIKTGFLTDAPPETKVGEKLEIKTYKGCPRWKNS